MIVLMLAWYPVAVIHKIRSLRLKVCSCNISILLKFLITHLLQFDDLFLLRRSAKERIRDAQECSKVGDQIGLEKSVGFQLNWAI